MQEFIEDEIITSTMILYEYYYKLQHVQENNGGNKDKQNEVQDSILSQDYLKRIQSLLFVQHME